MMVVCLVAASWWFNTGVWQAEGRDFRLVSQRVWNLLSHEFGFDWEIPRAVVARGPARKLTVEVYPVAFQVGLFSECSLLG